jgi:hypothetical protein
MAKATAMKAMVTAHPLRPFLFHLSYVKIDVAPWGRENMTFAFKLST